MFLAHIPPSPTQADDDARYFRHMLHIMIERGTDVAQALHAEITTGDPRDRSPTAVQDFELVNRGTRRAILLAQKVATDHAEATRTAPGAPGAPGASESPAHKPPNTPGLDRPDTATPDPAANQLAPERLERLDRDDDRGDDPAQRSFPDTLASIAADISPDLASDIREAIAHTPTPTLLPAITNCLTASHRRATQNPTPTNSVMAGLDPATPTTPPEHGTPTQPVMAGLDPATHAAPPEQASKPEKSPTEPNPPNSS